MRSLAPVLVVAVLAALFVAHAWQPPGPPLPRVVTGYSAAKPYAKDGAWASYLGDDKVCPGGDDASAALAEQKATAICLLNYARQRAGLTPLAWSSVLSRSAELKADAIVRCGQFSHEPCEETADAVAHEVGYEGTGFGENIYEGPGPYAPPRRAVDGWLNSQHHRENLLRDGWTEQGIAVVVVPRFDGQRDVAIWVSEFGRS